MDTKFFTVGPSQLYPTVKQHIMQALDEDILSIPHYGTKFKEFYKLACDNLRIIFKIPSSHHIFFIPSSTESMERIVANTVYKKCTHLIAGGFGKKFYDIAKDLKKEPLSIEISPEKKFSIENINLRRDTELLCITENETSTGMRLPLDFLSDLKRTHRSLLVAVDIVSSAPYSKLDYELIDMAFFSVQKGMGLPAGLGVLIVNEVAIEKAKYIESKNISIGSRHHSFSSYLEKEKQFIAPGTPNVLDIYLLSKVSSDFREYGIENIRNELEIKAKTLYSFFDSSKMYTPVVENPEYKSITTPVIKVNTDIDELVQNLYEEGYLVSKGYRPRQKEYIRIANFPAHKYSDVKGLINALSKAEFKFRVS